MWHRTTCIPLWNTNRPVRQNGFEFCPFGLKRPIVERCIVAPPGGRMRHCRRRTRSVQPIDVNRKIAKYQSAFTRCELAAEAVRRRRMRFPCAHINHIYTQTEILTEISSDCCLRLRRRRRRRHWHKTNYNLRDAWTNNGAWCMPVTRRPSRNVNGFICGILAFSGLTYVDPPAEKRYNICGHTVVHTSHTIAFSNCSLKKKLYDAGNVAAVSRHRSAASGRGGGAVTTVEESQSTLIRKRRWWSVQECDPSFRAVVSSIHVCKLTLQSASPSQIVASRRTWTVFFFSFARAKCWRNAWWMRALLRKLNARWVVFTRRTFSRRSRAEVYCFSSPLGRLKAHICTITFSYCDSDLHFYCKQ